MIALAANLDGTGFISGHADGHVIRWYVADDPNAKGQGKVLQHPVPPYALCWTSNHIVAAGCDKKIVVYSHDGVVFQQFDYYHDATEKEVMSHVPRETQKNVPCPIEWEVGNPSMLAEQI